LLDLNLSDDDDDESPDFRAILLTEGTTPETEYIRNLFWEQLFIALDELPEEQRQVFIWQELDDIPFNEIAEKKQVLTCKRLSRESAMPCFTCAKGSQQLYIEITQ